RKVSKLAKAAATKRVLLLERQHMNLYPKAICNEIDSRRAQFPQLAEVHEIWIVEKIPFFQTSEGDAHFELYREDECVRSFSFCDGQLLMPDDGFVPQL